jgi:hypothetical protein
LGLHEFKVTVTYGRADIITTRNVTYTVVGYATGTYAGRSFDIDYPAEWLFTAVETPEPGHYTDTTIESPDSPDTLIRVDVTPREIPDLQLTAQSEISAVSAETGYRRISLRIVRVNGASTLDWQFVVREDGMLLRKEDKFFSYPARHETFAVLTQAPVGQYPRLATEFAQLRATLVMR